MTFSIRSFRRGVIAACLVLGSGPIAAAQALGTIEGIARSDDDGTPIAFALIRLSAADPQSPTTAAEQQRITTGTGRFRFTDVSPGQYRLTLLRIGYRPVQS